MLPLFFFRNHPKHNDRGRKGDSGDYQEDAAPVCDPQHGLNRSGGRQCPHAPGRHLKSIDTRPLLFRKP